jgi:hypothetical protein
MAVKVLQCSDVVADSDCTLMLIGTADDIVEAFAAHAASRHGRGTHYASQAESKLQNAVYVSPDKAYIGDQFEHTPGTDTVHIPGAGAVIQLCAPADPASNAPGGVTLTCKCSPSGGGSCVLQIQGTLAACNNGACTNCGWVTEIPSPLAPPDKLLKA